MMDDRDIHLAHLARERARRAALQRRRVERAVARANAIVESADQLARAAAELPSVVKTKALCTALSAYRKARETIDDRSR